MNADELDPKSVQADPTYSESLGVYFCRLFKEYFMNSILRYSLYNGSRITLVLIMLLISHNHHWHLSRSRIPNSTETYSPSPLGWS